MPAIAKLVKPETPAGPRANVSDADYIMEGRTNANFHNGIPLTKPPYGELVAIDLDRGEIASKVPFGDDADLRKNPALKDVKLPDQLGAPGVQGSIVTRGGLIFIGGGDTAFHAVDTKTGKDLWHQSMGVRTSGTPMTYSGADGHQYVAIAVGNNDQARLVAFKLQ